MDENDLARFLDRRMSEDERGRAVAHLSASDEDAEVLADAAYLLRAHEAEDDEGVDLPMDADDTDTGTDAKVVPLRPPSTLHARPDTGTDATVVPLRPPSTQRARRRVPAQWLALAAVLAGVLLVLPPALSRGGVGDPVEYAALLANPQAGRAVDSMGARPWGSTRSDGDAFVGTENGRVARIGVLWVDLEVAVISRKPERADTLCRQIKDHLTRVSAGGTVAIDCVGIFREAGQSNPVAGDALRQGREAVTLYFEHDTRFALGAWAEAALLAATAQDAEFFAAKRSREALDHFAESDDIAPSARETAGKVRAQVRADGALNWTSLTESVRTLVVDAHRE